MFGHQRRRRGYVFIGEGSYQNLVGTNVVEKLRFGFQDPVGHLVSVTASPALVAMLEETVTLRRERRRSDDLAILLSTVQVINAVRAVGSYSAPAMDL